jgi:hypothetical protein
LSGLGWIHRIRLGLLTLTLTKPSSIHGPRLPNAARTNEPTEHRRRLLRLCWWRCSWRSLRRPRWDQGRLLSLGVMISWIIEEIVLNDQVRRKLLLSHNNVLHWSCIVHRNPIGLPRRLYELDLISGNVKLLRIPIGVWVQQPATDPTTLIVVVWKRECRLKSAKEITLLRDSARLWREAEAVLRGLGLLRSRLRF